jgi:hypothetical protein
MLTQVAQADSWWERVPSQVLGSQGEEHLPAMCRREEAGQTIQPGSEIVRVMWRRGGSMESHPYTYGSNTLRPQLLLQTSLRVKGRGHRIWRRGEGRLDGIPDDLEHDALVGLDPFPKYMEVALDRCRHRAAVSLPQRGAPFDVGEEEGDRS